MARPNIFLDAVEETKELWARRVVGDTIERNMLIEALVTVRKQKAVAETTEQLLLRLLQFDDGENADHNEGSIREQQHYRDLVQSQKRREPVGECH